MQLPIFFIIALVFVALLLAVVLVYLQIYKRNINRALQTDGAAPVRMAAPYKVAIGFIIVFLLVALTISLVMKEGSRINTPDELVRDAQSEETLEQGWDMEVAMDGSLAAVLLYNDDRTDHTFKVYKDKGGNRTNYVFVHGGSLTSVERSVWVYNYDGMRAMISMNEMGIAKIICHDGAEYAVDPDAPFALVLPSGGFDVYDASGEQIDLSDEWWYEEVDGN